MPTGFGVVFGSVVLFLFLIALGYQNNVVYAFVFFIGSIAVSAMIHTNSNVDKLLMEEPEHVLFFADENNPLRMHIQNPKTTASFGLKLKTPTDEVSIPQILAQNSAWCLITWRPKSRGPQSGPKLTLYSTHPVGLLRSWREDKSLKSVLVYPARKGIGLQQSQHLSGRIDTTPTLFREHREYHAGDLTRRIDWRKSQHLGKTLLRVFEGNEEKGIIHFDWQDTAELEDNERRLSQLCLWLTQAEKLGYKYSFRRESREVLPASGLEHLKVCLDELVRDR